MQDNVRPPFLLVLDLAAKRGESSIPLDAIKQRMRRGRLSKRLIVATATELEHEGFVKGIAGSDRRYGLSKTGEQWVRQSFGADFGSERKLIVPLSGSVDLPEAGTEFRAAVRREAMQKIAVAFVPLILVFLLFLVLR